MGVSRHPDRFILIECINGKPSVRIGERINSLTDLLKLISTADTTWSLGYLWEFININFNKFMTACSSPTVTINMIASFAMFPTVSSD
jgi:hypothetical protein